MFMREPLSLTADDYISKQIEVARDTWSPEDVDALERRINFYNTAFKLRQTSMEGAISANQTDDAHFAQTRTYFARARDMQHPVTGDALAFSQPRKQEATQIIRSYLSLKATEILNRITAISAPPPEPTEALLDEIRHRLQTGLDVADQYVVDGKVTSQRDEGSINHILKTRAAERATSRLDQAAPATENAAPTNTFTEPDPRWSPRNLAADRLGIYEATTLLKGNKLRAYMVNAMYPASQDAEKEIARRYKEAGPRVDSDQFKADNAALLRHADLLENKIKETMRKLDPTIPTLNDAVTAPYKPVHDLSPVDAHIVAETDTAPQQRGFWGRMKDRLVPSLTAARDVVTAGINLANGIARTLVDKANAYKDALVNSRESWKSTVAVGAGAGLVGSMAAFSMAAALQSSPTDQVIMDQVLNTSHTVTAQADHVAPIAPDNSTLTVMVAPAPIVVPVAAPQQPAKIDAAAPTTDTAKPVAKSKPRVHFHAASVSVPVASNDVIPAVAREFDIATMRADISSLKNACVQIQNAGLPSELCRELN